MYALIQENNFVLSHQRVRGQRGPIFSHIYDYGVFEASVQFAMFYNITELLFALECKYPATTFFDV